MGIGIEVQWKGGGEEGGEGNGVDSSAGDERLIAQDIDRDVLIRANCQLLKHGRQAEFASSVPSHVWSECAFGFQRRSRLPLTPNLVAFRRAGGCE